MTSSPLNSSGLSCAFSVQPVAVCIQNLQYALRKLEKRGLITKCVAARSKTAHYAITAAGREAVGLYAQIRAQLLTGRTELEHHSTNRDL